MIKFSKITLLSIFLVVFIIIAGFFAYQWWQVKGELVKQIEQNENLTRQVDELQKEIEELKISEEEIIEGEEIITEPSGWKIYRNEERGFEIKYPEDWEKEIVDPWYSINFTKEISQEKIRFAIGIDIYGEFGAPGSGSAGKEIIIEGIEVTPSIFSDLKNVHAVYLDMCFDEKLGYLGNYCPERKDEGYEGDYYQFYFRCEGEKWQGKEGRNKCSALFDQILSTFRLIKE